MEQQVLGKSFDAERALYHLQDALVSGCTFAGPADGESVLKEAGNIRVQQSRFSLRYPMWHVRGFTLEHSEMDACARAALWYSVNGQIRDCELGGVKAVRECEAITLQDCRITSAEFGWKSRGITMLDTTIASEYLFFDSRDVRLERVHMTGKYSFQYMENLEIRDSVLDTKDAFWHSKNVSVYDSEVRGEYLGWFSDGLTLVNCKIVGTQPLCYCRRLKLVNCTMEQTDLAFEYSDVEAQICGGIDSVKNPRSGEIVADQIGSVIRGDAVMECTGRVRLRSGEML